MTTSGGSERTLIIVGVLSVILLGIGVVILVVTNSAGIAPRTSNTGEVMVAMTRSRKAGIALTVIGTVGLSAVAGVFAYHQMRQNRVGKQSLLRESGTVLPAGVRGTARRTSYEPLERSFLSEQALSARSIGTCDPHSYITKPDRICKMSELDLYAGTVASQDDKPYAVRIGVVGDGSCMIHAIRRALGLAQLERLSMAEERRRVLAPQLSEVDCSALIDDKQQWVADSRDLLARPRKWLDNSFIPFFNRIFDINVIEMRYDNMHGYVVNTQPDASNGSSTRVVVIINIGAEHFETVGEMQPNGELETVFDRDSSMFVHLLRHAPYKSMVGQPLGSKYTVQTMPVIIPANAANCENVTQRLDHMEVCLLEKDHPIVKASLYRVGTKRIAGKPISSVIHAVALAHHLEIEPGDVDSFIVESLGIELPGNEWNGALVEIESFLQTLANYFQTDIFEARRDGDSVVFTPIVSSNVTTNNMIAVYKSPVHSNHYEIVGHLSRQVYMNGVKDVVAMEIRKDRIFGTLTN